MWTCHVILAKVLVKTTLISKDVSLYDTDFYKWSSLDFSQSVDDDIFYQTEKIVII